MQGLGLRLEMTVYCEAILRLGKENNPLGNGIILLS